MLDKAIFYFNQELNSKMPPHPHPHRSPSAVKRRCSYPCREMLQHETANTPLPAQSIGGFVTEESSRNSHPDCSGRSASRSQLVQVTPTIGCGGVLTVLIRFSRGPARHYRPPNPLIHCLQLRCD